MTSDRAPLPLDDPALLPFLPMVHIAWADGDLSPEEVGEICRRIGDPCSQVLGPWLDPSNPPTPEDLKRLLHKVREAVPEMARRDRLSLTGLGLELAQAGGREVTTAEREALEQLEEILGLAGGEAARQLLATRRPKAPPPVADFAFEVKDLARWLDGDLHELRQRVRRLLLEPDLRPPAEPTRAEYRRWTLEACRRLAAEDLGGLGFPVTYGGGEDTGAFIAVFETLAYGDLSVLVKYGVQFGLFGGSIFQLGTEKHHRRYLADVASLELPGCFAMTETGHGSNVQDLETTATYDPEKDELVIHTPHEGARKDYIGNAAQDGRMATVFAQLTVGGEEHGIHAVLVPIRDAAGKALPGVSIEDDGPKMGLGGVDNGRLLFDRVRVPRENLLDRFGSIDEGGRYNSPIASPSKRFFTMLGTLVGGRVSVALAANSVSKTALAIAVRYGSQRRQFGPEHEPENLLLDYPTHQRRLLPPLATTYALHFALDHLRRQYAATGPDDDRRELEAHAAGLKAYATWHATGTVQEARECCGGQGYLSVNRFAALKADSDVFTTFEGDNTVLLQLVAKGLLSGYSRQFHRMGFLGLVRFLSRRAGMNLMEQNPLVTRRNDPEHLLDRDFHRAAFRFRENHRLSSVARRLKKRIDSGMEISEALLETQHHLVETALAHVENRLLEGFDAAVSTCPDPDLRRALLPLVDLFALSRLEADRGWYLEHGYFEPPKARALRPLVNRLCAAVRRQAVPLVDGFGISDDLLGAPIAR